jgi:hypothetical protein
MSAFEADRFNRSRTSPEKQRLAVSNQHSAIETSNSFASTQSPKPAFLPPAPEEFLQDIGTAARQYPPSDFNPVIQARVIQHMDDGTYRARLRIIRAVDQSPDARMNQRSRAHRARLNCSKQVAVPQTMVADRGACLAQRNDFRMRRWVAIGNVPVESAADNLTLMYDHRADRDFAHFESALRRAQGFLHPEFVVGGIHSTSHISIVALRGRPKPCMEIQ